MHTSYKKIVELNSAQDNLWLRSSNVHWQPVIEPRNLNYTVLDSERAVGQAMFEELCRYSEEKPGDLVIVLLGGRGAQAMYKILSDFAKTDALDALLGRLHVFTQDALAPLRMNNALSFVRDFERLLGESFFRKIKTFTPMQTETPDVKGELVAYIEKLDALGGIDLFFLGLGPEANDASHLCYIKPDSGASLHDFAGIIPISSTILEHHISKFKVGGSAISPEDEDECRGATHILTLGPGAILGARRIVQSVVDASTAPAKRGSFRRLLETDLSIDVEELEKQAEENPGLLLRMHPDVRSYILPDLVN